MGSSGLGTDDERWAAGNGGGQWQCGLICGRWPGATAPAGSGSTASRALPGARWRPSPALIRRRRPSSTRIRGGQRRPVAVEGGDDDGDDGDHEEGDG